MKYFFKYTRYNQQATIMPFIHETYEIQDESGNYTGETHTFGNIRESSIRYTMGDLLPQNFIKNDNEYNELKMNVKFINCNDNDNDNAIEMTVIIDGKIYNTCITHDQYEVLFFSLQELHDDMEESNDNIYTEEEDED